MPEEHLAHQSGTPLEPLDSPLSLNALDGHLLARVTHRTIPESLIIVNHRELVQFKIRPGYPWLKLHNPYIDWSRGSITKWSPCCHVTFPHSAMHPPGGHPPTLSAEPPDLQMCYWSASWAPCLLVDCTTSHVDELLAAGAGFFFVAKRTKVSIPA